VLETSFMPDDVQYRLVWFIVWYPKCEL